ncbi:MAG TPA: hypothetical protein VK468_10140, partial [Pyrinomonadaceae bacterium]|nr:hypothetical protein [Pyrinomonadaceae bacterium]
LVDKAGAKFKSDEKALTLLRQARQAIGGDSAVDGVRSMSITGTTTRTVRTESGETVDVGGTEIALQLPDKMMKIIKLGDHDGIGGEAVKQVDVTVVRSDKDGNIVTENIEGDGGPGAKTIFIEKGAGETEDISGDGQHRIIVRKTADGSDPGSAAGAGDGKRIMIRREHAGGDHEAFRQNELLRMTLSLLLSAPQGMDVSYTFGGETDVDGTPCNLVNADFGGSAIQLFLSKATSLPVMMSYTGHAMPMIFKVRTKSPDAGIPAGDMIFKRVGDGPEGEAAEFQVRFADYRTVGGIQLPFKWTTTTAGPAAEVFDVTAYDLNPANIADKFQKQNVFYRTQKADGQK